MKMNFYIYYYFLASFTLTILVWILKFQLSIPLPLDWLLVIGGAGYIMMRRFLDDKTRLPNKQELYTLANGAFASCMLISILPLAASYIGVLLGLSETRSLVEIWQSFNSIYQFLSSHLPLAILIFAMILGVFFTYFIIRWYFMLLTMVLHLPSKNCLPAARFKVSS